MKALGMKKNNGAAKIDSGDFETHEAAEKEERDREKQADFDTAGLALGPDLIVDLRRAAVILQVAEALAHLQPVEISAKAGDDARMHLGEEVAYAQGRAAGGSAELRHTGRL